jgi:beta-ribofuranosylaminobenzene 5'-phosphate synthase
MKVWVKTPARLHFGLIDMNGELGRLFGGLGVGIDKPNVIVAAENSEDFSIQGQEVELANSIVQRFFSTYHLPPKVNINIQAAIPAHIGLGSGTQLSIAIAIALARLFSVKASVPELAVAMGRAKRTAVGTTIFEQGGLVIDGGKNQRTNSFPPVIFRQPIPAEWRFIVAIPNTIEGLSNSQENHAFEKLTKMPSEDVGQICRLIMLKLLPALAERDIQSFGDALTKIQIITGNHFAQAQGGTFASPAATECLAFMKNNGAYGVGQSSWGPALYGVVTQQDAEVVLRKVKSYLSRDIGGRVFIAKANNRGATIKVIGAKL